MGIRVGLAGSKNVSESQIIFILSSIMTVFPDAYSISPESNEELTILHSFMYIPWAHVPAWSNVVMDTKKYSWKVMASAYK